MKTSTLVRQPRIFRALDRRTKLILITKRAFDQWGRACQTYHNVASDIRPVQSCISEASRTAQNKLRRYNALESLLADESGVPKHTLLNVFANWNGFCPSLVANL